MYNFQVVIDAGHGGSDPGAVSGSTREKDLTLQISQYMYEKFKDLGVPVYLTRSSDETLGPTERVNRILNAFGNNENVIVISNHINSNTTGTAEGAEVIYALRNEKTLAENILKALGEAGQKTRMIFQRRLPSDTSKDYYFIHRNTGRTQPVIVEYGFINNENDLNRIKNNYQRYVDAVVDAVIMTETGSVPSVSGDKYVVKSGDTLYKIARDNNTTVSAIKDFNNLTGDTLMIGQVLKLPTTASSVIGSTYTVKAGDTLYNIARRFNTSIDEIQKLNNLTSANLSIGQVLKIPTASVNEEPQELGNYVVKKGDTLWNLAGRYDTNVNEIKRLNNLTSDALSIGQILRIPNYKGDLPSSTYVVRSGDTLWNIARSYNTTVDDIKKLNNLTSNLLSVGQVLILPTP